MNLEKKKNNYQKPINNWMRYSALGTELLVVLGLSVWGGIKADEWLNCKPLFLVLLPLLGLGVVFYQLLKSLSKKD